MAPNGWVVFVSFGIPLGLGLLGVAHGVRSLRDREGLSRTRLAWDSAVLVGSLLLVAHASRWLLRIYGV